MSFFFIILKDVGEEIEFNKVIRKKMSEKIETR